MNESRRLYSIDVFRALTMLLMIFVNDTWSLVGVPNWIEHAEAGEDRLGFADTIFPAFLFIVGLSIPIAIRNRIAKGDSRTTLFKHILIRSLSLLIIGVFHINLEEYNRTAILPMQVWELIITLAFFLIWLDYPKTINKTKQYSLQGLGFALLITMAILYKGGSTENPEWMRFHWWGILGLIGWAYLISATLYLLIGDRIELNLVALMFFILFCCFEKLGLLEPIYFIRPYFWIIGDGAMPALVMGGIVVSLFYQRWLDGGQMKQFWLAMFGFAINIILFGYLTRPWWGIHKIDASPSWVTICIGYSTLVFGFLIWLIDLKKKEGWFSMIKPAGTSTLTAYLLPYVHYAIYGLIGISLPLVLRTGVVGIAKSLLYAFIIVVITGLLEKKKIRLKL